MTNNLKLVVNNVYLDQNQKFFFEKKELKIILDLYAKMVSEGSWKDYGLNISSKHPLINEIFSGKKGSTYFKPSN